MESGLYEGRVRHRRRRPVEHAFELPLFMLYLDLGELDEVFRGRWLWSTRRPAFAWLRRRDYLGDPTLPLDRCVRDLVEGRTGRRPTGPVRLLTNLRTAGIAMNPVSFYYCFDRGGRRPEFLVAEVTNTPWGERHCYVLELGDRSDGPQRRVAGASKELHVSPFMGMEQAYRFRLEPPGERLVLHIANLEGADSAPVFDATLSLQRRELDTRSLAGALLRYPLLTTRIAFAIYFQALRLWLRGAPFHPHPNARASARTLETT